MGRGRPKKIKEVEMTKPEVRNDILDDLDSIMSGVGASIAGTEVVDDQPVRPVDMSGTLDITTSVALAQADAEFEVPEPTVMEGDEDDPFDVRSFKTCMNGGCDFRAGCLRWRLRLQRREYETEAMFFADQDKCLVRADAHVSDFALDPIEDWS